MSNQRSILSFFSTPGASAKSSKTTLPQTSTQTASATPPPPPPPPPPSSRFVPPPPRTGYSMPPGGAATPSPRTPAPQPTLPTITPEQGRAILVQAGATLDGDTIVFHPSVAAAASSSSSRPLTSSCRIVYPRPQDIPGLVSVNAILLPVRYQDSFYHGVTDLTRYSNLFNRIILDEDDKVVGGIIGRLEKSPFDDNNKTSDSAATPRLTFYIQSLALSSPFRGSGLMAAALGSILRTIDVLNRGEQGLGFGSAVTSLYCHVWTENDDALRWYQANGFRRDTPEPLANYYFKLQPNTAWVVRRDLAPPPSVLQAVQAAQAAQAAQAGPPKATTKTQGGPPPKLQSSQSYQNSRPEMEWNDLPADMVTASAPASAVASRPVSTAPSATGSMASSPNVSLVNLTETSADDNTPPPPRAGGNLKASSTIRKKRERAYPAAMFQ